MLKGWLAIRIGNADNARERTYVDPEFPERSRFAYFGLMQSEDKGTPSYDRSDIQSCSQ